MNLATRIKHEPSRNTTILKASLAIPALYVCLPLLAISCLFISVVIPFLTFAVYQFLHTLSLFCFLYPIYFISTRLVSVEQGRTAKIGDVAIPFLLIVLFPIGLFYIHPRLKDALLLADR